MKSRNIKGIKKDVKDLRFKLQNIAEQLRENIDDDSKKTKKLLQEYKKIQEQIEMEEARIEEIKSIEEERKTEEARKREEERRKEETRIKHEEQLLQEMYDDIIREQQEVLEKIMFDKDNAIQEFENKQSKINQKIGSLEYTREECLQTLQSIQLKRSLLEQELEKAKEEDDIHKRIEIKQKMQELQGEEEKTDSKLEKVKARLAINMLIKASRDRVEIEKITKIIEEYNLNASEYGLEKIDIPEFVKSHQTEEQLFNIRKQNQTKYNNERIADTIEINLNAEGENVKYKKLRDEEREEIEKESQNRVEDRRKNLLPIKIIRSTGNRIAKIAGTIVGSAILAGKTVVRGVQGLWQNIRKGTNKTLIGANQLMLKGTTKLREKLEEDAQTFEKRREKLTSNLKTSVDEEKAVQVRNENNKEQNQENVK